MASDTLNLPRVVDSIHIEMSTTAGVILQQIIRDFDNLYLPESDRN